MAKKKNGAKTRPVVKSRQEMSTLVGEIVEAQAVLNDLRQEMAQRQAEVAKVYEVRMGEIGRLVEGWILAAEAWATAHPEEFNGRKSIDFPHAVVGFRKTPPKVVTRRHKDTLKAAVERLRKLAWGRKYVRVPPPALDKERILADRDKLTEDQLMLAGLAIRQKDEFYLDPKAEALEQGATVKEA